MTTIALSDRHVSIDIESGYLPAWTHDQEDIDEEIEAVVEIVRSLQRQSAPDRDILDNPFPEVGRLYAERYTSPEARSAAYHAGRLLPDDTTFSSALDVACVYLEAVLRRHAIIERLQNTSESSPAVTRLPFTKSTSENNESAADD
jgi:hypothetical protein